jgi:hypothetical protein
MYIYIIYIYILLAHIYIYMRVICTRICYLIHELIASIYIERTPWPESASELYRPPTVDEVSANFLWIEAATWSA